MILLAPIRRNFFTDIQCLVIFIPTSHLYAASTSRSLLFVAEVLLVVHTLIVDEAVVLSGDFLSGSEACARLGLVDSRHSGLGGCGLWVLFLRNGVAGVDPVEVYIYGLCEV